MGEFGPRLALGIKYKSYLKNKIYQKGWRPSSSARVPAKHTGGPRFKFHYCQKKKKKIHLFLYYSITHSIFYKITIPLHGCHNM
jgi:hypothetical protein